MTLPSPAITRERRAEQKISRIYGNLVSAMIVLHWCVASAGLSVGWVSIREVMGERED